MVGRCRGDDPWTRDVDRGWAWVVLATSCIQQAIQAMTYTSGLFNIMFLDEFGKDRQTTAWIGSVQISSLSLYGPISSLLIQHIGSSRTVILGGFLGFLGFLLSYFATDFVFIFFSFGFLIGLGTGISYLPWVVVIGNHFQKYRNLAYGIISTSVGFGTMALSPLIQYLEATYGWRGCMLIMAAIYLNIVAVGLSYRSSVRPSKMRGEVVKDINLDNEDDLHLKRTKDGLNIKDSHLSNPLTASMISLGSRYSSKTSLSVESSQMFKAASPIGSIRSLRSIHLKEEPLEKALFKSSFHEKVSQTDDQNVADLTTEETSGNSGEATVKKRPLLVVLQNRRLLILAINSFCTTGCLYLIFMHFPNSFRLSGASDDDLSVIMTGVGLASITSRLLLGLASNSPDVNAQVLYFSSGGISGLVMLMGPSLGTTFVGQMIFAVLLGLYGNAANTLLPVVTLELCVLDDLSAAYGIQLLMCGISSLLAPPFGGWLYDITGDYGMTFYFAGTTYIFGSLMMMLIPLMPDDDSKVKPPAPRHNVDTI